MTIRVQWPSGRFEHLADDTPARLKTATAEGPMVPLGSFATGQTVEYHDMGKWRPATVLGAPKVVEFKVVLQETPMQPADSLGPALFERVRTLESLASCDRVTP